MIIFFFVNILYMSKYLIYDSYTKELSGIFDTFETAILYYLKNNGLERLKLYRHQLLNNINNNKNVAKSVQILRNIEDLYTEIQNYNLDDTQTEQQNLNNRQNVLDYDAKINSLLQDTQFKINKKVIRFVENNYNTHYLH